MDLIDTAGIAAALLRGDQHMPNCPAEAPNAKVTGETDET